MPSGELRDLMVLAYSVEASHAAIAAVGIAESLYWAAPSPLPHSRRLESLSVCVPDVVREHAERRGDHAAVRHR